MEPTFTLGSPRARALLDRALLAIPPRLDLAALSIATLEFPELDVTTCEQALDQLARRVLDLRPGTSQLSQVQALRRVLGDEEGFRGSNDEYPDPEDSFLNRVLERKLGMPISLAVVYLEVGRRAGIPLFGVSLPGHFLVVCELGPDRKLVVDPYHGGQLLTETGCEDLLKKVAPQVKFSPKMLAAAPVKAVAYRMMSSLKRVYLHLGDGERALKVVDLMLALAPDHPGELRARAAILLALGAYRAALLDVERCLALSPDAPDHQSLRITATALRERVEFLN